MCWGYSGRGWSGAYFGWGWNWLLTAGVLILLFAVIITAVVLAIRYLSSGPRHGDVSRPSAEAEDLLAQRFARGEIDDAQYRQRVTALREHR